LGLLPEPKDGYRVKWPDLDSLGEQGRAALLLTRTQAYAAYTQGNLSQMIPEKEYMTKWDNVEEDEADAVLQSASDAQEDQDAEDQDTADQHGFVPKPPDGFQNPPPPPPVPGQPGKPGQLPQAGKVPGVQPPPQQQRPPSPPGKPTFGQTSQKPKNSSTAEEGK
jgi:hypothetical protein